MKIVQVRTECNLMKVLADGCSPAWVVSDESMAEVTHVHVVNWDGTQRIEGVYDRAASVRNHPDHPEGRLTIAFCDAKIVNCKVEFAGQNPVTYIQA